MTLAVNAHFQPVFREGSALATCTQKIRDLCAKVYEFFLKILQTILPCVFKPSAPLVVQSSVPDPRIAAVQQQALPQPPVPAAAQQVPQVVPPPAARLPEREDAPQFQPPPPPPAVPEPAPQPGPAAAAAEEVVHQAPLPGPGAAAAAVVHEAPPPPDVPREPAAAPQPGAEEALPAAAAQVEVPGQPAAPQPRLRRHGAPDPDDVKEGDQFAHLFRDMRNLGPGQRRRAAVAAMRQIRRQRQVAAAAAKSSPKEIQLIGKEGLNAENWSAGPFVILEVIAGLWNKILDQSEEISPDLLDEFVRRGIGSAADCEADFALEEFVASNREVQIVPLPSESGPIGQVLKEMQEAMENRPLLGGFLVRERETYALFMYYNVNEKQRQFFLVDPNGSISFKIFDQPETLEAYFLEDRRKEDDFTVFALEKVNLPDQVDADVGYKRERSVDLAGAHPEVD